MRILWSVIFVASFLISCGKKEQQCTQPIYDIPQLYVSFTGFSTTELDTIIIEQYKSGSHFTQQISMTKITDSLFFENDTAIIIDNGFETALDKQYDYVISVPKTGDVYQIEQYKYSGPSVITWQAEECQIRTRLRTIDSVTINSVSTKTAKLKTNQARAFLVRQ